MAGEEVHMLLARVRPWDTRANIVQAGSELALAAQLAGDRAQPELHYWLGLYHERWRRFANAERELRAAAEAAPNQPRYWLALSQLLAREDRLDAPDPQMLEDAVARLRPLARSAQALNFLARYYSDRGEVELGLPFAERAVAAEHGCWECADTLVMLQNLKHTPAPVTPEVYTKPGIY
jgi:tetratricopeptide (TPR) repeat protein